MIESQIIAEIGARIGNLYSAWTIGITDDPARRKNEHQAEGGNVTYWHDWKADSEAAARRIEKHFLDSGCKGSTGGGLRPTFVYIF
jgi:hypothetical protein